MSLPPPPLIIPLRLIIKFMSHLQECCNTVKNSDFVVFSGIYRRCIPAIPSSYLGGPCYRWCRCGICCERKHPCMRNVCIIRTWLETRHLKSSGNLTKPVYPVRKKYGFNIDTTGINVNHRRVVCLVFQLLQYSYWIGFTVQQIRNLLQRIKSFRGSVDQLCYLLVYVFLNVSLSASVALRIESHIVFPCRIVDVNEYSVHFVLFCHKSHSSVCSSCLCLFGCFFLFGAFGMAWLGMLL